MLVCAQSDEGARAGTAIVRRRRLRRPCLCWRQHWSPSLGKCMLYAALVPTILALTLIQAGGATAACREVAQRRRQKQEREQRSSCLPWELLQGAERCAQTQARALAVGSSGTLRQLQLQLRRRRRRRRQPWITMLMMKTVVVLVAN